ncbi:DNA-binding protein [Actinocorallia libanotica]|uniref:DNA-binding protein n=1 Tax=Actinocorallia libanotica TaxID=46162 RepID=UPI0031D1BC3F
MSDVEGLLEAGAVLPPGTGDAGENAVPLTARTYRHPALDGRVVVRLVDSGLGEGEDLAAGFLGLETAAEPEVVGVGRRDSLNFPEWVLVHHPADGQHALALVPELERIAQRAKSKPKAALTAFQELAGRLASSLPHLLPTFYERVAREFLAVENLTIAAQVFTRARTAETEHGLPIDEERTDAVFLEFALAGALQIKTLSAYAADLSQRVPADEALRRFTRLCVRRTAGGVAPSSRMATDLRRLAKAAGEDAKAVEHAYLAEVLDLPATARAAEGWWKAHRQALVSLAKERPEVCGKLLNLVPQDPEYGSRLPVLWLEMLEESGATAVLCDPDGAPEEARPEDGSAGWLKRFHWFCARKKRGAYLPFLYPLVERMAGRLKAELTAAGEGMTAFPQPDLLDLLLELGVPVADPRPGQVLNLNDWAGGEKQRSLLALAADHRFRAVLRHNIGRSGRGSNSTRAFQKLLDSPGGRPVLAEWVTELAREAVVPGLPDLPARLEGLSWLQGPVLALAEKEVRAVAATDLAPILARSLRAGLFDELGWPAWEEALEHLGGRNPYEVRVAEAWPYLIVAGHAQVRVIGAEGTVLVHDLRVPAGDMFGEPGFRYVDGDLLVHWSSRQRNGGKLGYWHTAADRQQPMTGAAARSVRLSRYQPEICSVPLPGGGRTTGLGVLHRGDTALPPSRHVISDGTSYWVWLSTDGDDLGYWYAYDPLSGEVGQQDMPAFFAEATSGLPEGSVFTRGMLLPPAFDAAGPDGASVGGMDGWRVVRLPDGSVRGEDLAGNAVTVPAGRQPVGALFLPGDDGPRALIQGDHQLELADPDGVITSRVRTDRRFGRVTLTPLPPAQYWQGMRPRDPRGSKALRRIDGETAAALLKAAQGEGELLDSVRALIPELTHEDLIAEVGEVVRFAAHRQATLDGIAQKLDQALAPAVAAEVFEGPSDTAIEKAVKAVFQGRSGAGPCLFTLVEHMRRAMAGRYAGERRETHLEGIGLPYTALRFDGLLPAAAALTHLAVSEFTPSKDREVLSTLLRTLSDLGMLGDDGARARWRMFQLRLDAATAQSDTGKKGTRRALLPLEGGAFLAVLNFVDKGADGVDFPAIFYDPAGRFEVPSRYQVLSSEPLPAPEGAFSPDGVLAEAAVRGPAPWFPEAAEEFARRTGVTVTLAKLVLAGLPGIDHWERNFLPAETRTALKVKVAEAAVAKDELKKLGSSFRRALLGALVPADPSRLWTDGPDAAAAAEVWNAGLGRRVTVPEELLSEVLKAVRVGRPTGRVLQALLDPVSAPELSRDLRWVVNGRNIAPETGQGTGFDEQTLVGSVMTAVWLAHRLPAGDPLRARLPAALAAVRERLANPDLILRLDRYAYLQDFRKVAGNPTETGDGYERYGAVVLPTADPYAFPGIKVALLDERGEDPYLPVLRAGDVPARVETALGMALDERFAALLADPGDPVAGERDADGTWWPQDPSRSVPGLVAEAASRYDLGPDAAVVYLMLLAMPDPTDKNTARWTGWKPARLKAARAELAATDLVVEARRARAGRSLFLPGGWNALRAPHLPQEEWKLPLYGLAGDVDSRTLRGALVPVEPVADLYRRAWRRITEGDVPRFADLEIRRGRRR